MHIVETMGRPNYEVAAADVDDDVDLWLTQQRRSWIARNVTRVSVVVAVLGASGAIAATIRYRAVVSSRTAEMRELDARVEGLRSEQATRRQELAEVERSIDASREQLVVAQHQAEAAQCRAANAKLDAEITVERVSCYQQVANFYMCDANNQKDKADGAMLGALIGAGLAVATGGGSLLVVGGAALGQAEKGNADCPAVNCELEPAAIERAVLAKHALSARAVCEDEARS